MKTHGPGCTIQLACTGPGRGKSDQGCSQNRSSRWTHMEIFMLHTDADQRACHGRGSRHLQQQPDLARGGHHSAGPDGTRRGSCVAKVGLLCWANTQSHFPGPFQPLLAVNLHQRPLLCPWRHPSSRTPANTGLRLAIWVEKSQWFVLTGEIPGKGFLP